MPKNKAKPVKRLKEPSATNASEQTLNVSHHTRAEVATEQQFKNEEADPDAIKVLLTGFGPFLDIKNNPSFEVVSRLPNTVPNTYPPIQLYAHPEPIKAAYHAIAKTVPAVVEEHNPDVIIHVGLAVDRAYFAIEAGADRDGYHDIPDEERRVFTRLEIKEMWGKSPARLNSTMNMDEVVRSWKRIVGKDVDVRQSDDVGNYVCGFLYYLSLEQMWKSGKMARVVFLHVPPLKTERELQRGSEIVLGLVKAIVESGTM